MDIETIEGAQLAKNELRAVIESACARFTLDTGMTVDAIDIQNGDYRGTMYEKTSGENVKAIMCRVNLSVSL